MHRPKVNPRFIYEPLSRVDINGSRHYLTPGGVHVPSVTTILSATKDSTGINEWVQKVGEEEATRIKNEAARIGTGMHNNLENYMLGRPIVGSFMEQSLAKLIIKRGFPRLTEVWGIEVALYSAGLYAGTTDLVAVLDNGEPAIVDFKNSRTPKRVEWIDDYKAQLGAYALAHNEMFGTDIRQGLIMMACRTGEYQEFYFTGADFEQCIELWLSKLSLFLETVS